MGGDRGRGRGSTSDGDALLSVEAAAAEFAVQVAAGAFRVGPGLRAQIQGLGRHHPAPKDTERTAISTEEREEASVTISTAISNKKRGKAALRRSQERGEGEEEANADARQTCVLCVIQREKTRLEHTHERGCVCGEGAREGEKER